MPVIKIGKSRGHEFDYYYELHGGNNVEKIVGESGSDEQQQQNSSNNNNGKEKVILIMGFLTPCHAWNKNLEKFIQDLEFEYCIFDNRGVAKSGAPTTTYSSHSMAMDIIDLMDHLKWEKCHIVGVSMGGMISLELAYHAPERIKSLALVVTTAGSMAPLRGIVGITKSIFIKDHTKRALVLSEILYSKDYLGKQSVFTPEKTNLQVFVDRYVQDMNAMVKPPPISALYGHIRVVNTHNVSKKRLLKIKDTVKNITIITGDADDLVKSSSSFYLNEVLSPSEFVVFKGSGHSVNIENYEEFHDAISRNFKRGCSSTTTTTASITTDNL